MLALLTEFMGSFAYGLVTVGTRSAKIFCSDSETKATNTDICFEDLATDAQRFLSFVCYSRILPLPLATLLLVI